jgi:hypothetical protein
MKPKYDFANLEDVKKLHEWMMVDRNERLIKGLLNNFKGTK